MATALVQGKTPRTVSNIRTISIALYIIRRKADIVAQLPVVAAMKSRLRRTEIDVER